MSNDMTTSEFDPTEHTVPEVVEHLDTHPDDAARILEAEQAGKARKGVLEHDAPASSTDYLGQAAGDTDQLGRPIEDGKDYLGRDVG